MGQFGGVVPAIISNFSIGWGKFEQVILNI